jgi:hypothetical protein
MLLSVLAVWLAAAPVLYTVVEEPRGCAIVTRSAPTWKPVRVAELAGPCGFQQVDWSLAGNYAAVMTAAGALYLISTQGERRALPDPPRAFGDARLLVSPKGEVTLLLAEQEGATRTRAWGYALVDGAWVEREALTRDPEGMLSPLYELALWKKAPRPSWFKERPATAAERAKLERTAGDKPRWTVGELGSRRWAWTAEETDSCFSFRPLVLLLERGPVAVKLPDWGGDGCLNLLPSAEALLVDNATKRPQWRAALVSAQTGKVLLELPANEHSPHWGE